MFSGLALTVGITLVNWSPAGSKLQEHNPEGQGDRSERGAEAAAVNGATETLIAHLEDFTLEDFTASEVTYLDENEFQSSRDTTSAVPDPSFSGSTGTPAGIPYYLAGNGEGPQVRGCYDDCIPAGSAITISPHEAPATWRGLKNTEASSADKGSRSYSVTSDTPDMTKVFSYATSNGGVAPVSSEPPLADPN